MYLSNLEILNFDLHLCLGITYLTLAAKHGALIKLGEINVSELNIFVHELGNLIGLINILFDVFSLLSYGFYLLIILHFAFILPFKLFHCFLLSFFILKHLLFDKLKFNLHLFFL